MFDDFYGLKGRPFQLTPDPAFYFESLTHRKALSYLSYGMAQGEGFVVVTGEVGSGKSTLVAHLMSTCQEGNIRSNIAVISNCYCPVPMDSEVASDPTICANAERPCIINWPNNIF